MYLQSTNYTGDQNVVLEKKNHPIHYHLELQANQKKMYKKPDASF